jgi:CheY-like chemotaxis protein
MFYRFEPFVASMCPVWWPSNASEGDDASEGGIMDPSLRIVLVKNESITALDVARQLRRLGYRVVAVAKTGPQAIEQALTHHPDAVLMDIHLQGPMDGVDAARHIRASARIPVVCMSGNVDAATRERIQSTATAELVPKPVHLPTLHATLQRVCSRLSGDLHS